eukprot:COSAG01_NODE_2422_length_7726_cov_5.781172_5_plen_83_part_00
MAGGSRQELPHLEGRQLVGGELMGTQQEGAAGREHFGGDPQSGCVEWVVKGDGVLTVTIDCGRGGILREQIHVRTPEAAASL